MIMPWDRLMDAAERVENSTKNTYHFRLAVGWFLRREAGHAAASFAKLRHQDVPIEYAQALVTSDGGYIVASSLADEIGIT